MDRHLSLAILGMLLTACVTVNVYFPASAAERAADIFIKDVYGTGEGDTQPGADDEAVPEPTGSLPGDLRNTSVWENALAWFIRSAHAQQPDINIATPGINALKKAMEQRHRGLLPFYGSGAIGMSKDGLLVIRDPKAVGLKQRNSVKKLVADENRDRNRLYAEIAKANGHPEWEPDIRNIFAQRWVGNAPGRVVVSDGHGWLEAEIAFPMMNVFVFDIETVPDVDSARRLWDLQGLDDHEVANVMFSKRSRETEGRTEFLRHHLHRIVAISAVLRVDDRLTVWSLGEEESSEAELVERFFEGIERFSPTIVSWNGGGFDLPVLNYRALLHGVRAPRYWDTGEDDRSFRYNNYLGRFHWRHIDLMDVLAAYQPRAAASLDEIASMLGFPGKFGMSGADVWENYQQGGIAAIRAYCESDVLNTYLVYLCFERMRGHLMEAQFHAETDRLREYLRASDKPHLVEFLKVWTRPEDGTASADGAGSGESHTG